MGGDASLVGIRAASAVRHAATGTTTALASHDPMVGGRSDAAGDDPSRGVHLTLQHLHALSVAGSQAAAAALSREGPGGRASVGAVHLLTGPTRSSGWPLFVDGYSPRLLFLFAILLFCRTVTGRLQWVHTY